MKHEARICGDAALIFIFFIFFATLLAALAGERFVYLQSIQEDW
ncbi:MAG: hypothetical protein ACP5E9_00800 [Candidatus Methanospirareceae archaeon]